MGRTIFADTGFLVALLAEHDRDRDWALADACLVRMTELLPDPLVLTTDQHFQIYRRAGRRVVPYLAPG